MEKSSIKVPRKNVPYKKTKQPAQKKKTATHLASTATTAHTNIAISSELASQASEKKQAEKQKSSMQSLKGQRRADEERKEKELEIRGMKREESLERAELTSDESSENQSGEEDSLEESESEESDEEEKKTDVSEESTGLFYSIGAVPPMKCVESDGSRTVKNKRNSGQQGEQPGKRAKRTLKAKKKDENRLVVNVAHCIYEVVRFVCRRHFGMKVVRKEERLGRCEEWDLCWIDTGMTQDKLARLKPFQRINHFPSTYNISRKDQLARNLNRMRKELPQEYSFYPQTWLLPSEYQDFRAQFNERRAKTFIIKPEAASQGYGIFLTRSPENVSRVERLVAQRYIHKPYLIDSLKFDLRLYVLLAGCDPLRIFLFNEGLTRLSTEPYRPPQSTNMNNSFVHLTNYAINKHHEDFQFNETADKDDIGHKRSLSFFWRHLREREKGKVDIPTLKAQINDLIIKTMCAVQPLMANSYRAAQPNDLTNAMAFEVLGFDILIDAEFKPWLLEVNHTPSFSTDTPLDRKIKKGIISDTIRLLNLSYQDKQK